MAFVHSLVKVDWLRAKRGLQDRYRLLTERDAFFGAPSFPGYSCEVLEDHPGLHKVLPVVTQHQRFPIQPLQPSVSHCHIVTSP